MRIGIGYVMLPMFIYKASTKSHVRSRSLESNLGPLEFVGFHKPFSELYRKMFGFVAVIEDEEGGCQNPGNRIIP